ncbi:MAG: peptidoglycan-binding domain-containing protein [Cyanobacteriota bacterium]
MNKCLKPSFAKPVDVHRWTIYSSVLGLLMMCLSHTSAKVGGDFAVAQTMTQPLPTAPINRPILRLGSEGAAVSELQATLKLLGYYTDVVDGFYRESTAIAVSKFQQAAGLTPDGITGPATWNRLFPSTPISTSSTAKKPSPTSANNPASSFPVPSIIQTTTTDNRVSTGAPEQPAERRQTPPQNNNRPSSTPITTSSSTNSQTTTVTLPILRQGMQGPAVTQLQERLKRLGFLQGTVDGVFGEATQTAVKAAQQKFNLEPDGVVGPATWSALMR